MRSGSPRSTKNGYSTDDKRNPIKTTICRIYWQLETLPYLRGLPVDNFGGLGVAETAVPRRGVDAGVDFKDRTQAFVVPKEDIAAQIRPLY